MPPNVPVSISGLTERDIDLLLVEELFCSPAFRLWFLSQVVGHPPTRIRLLAAKRSVSTALGESDVEAHFEVGERQRWIVLVENKGQSGNPNGRPKGTLNRGTVLARALDERVVINENGRRRTVTKWEAATKQLANKAASGDLNAMRLASTLLETIRLTSAVTVLSAADPVRIFQEFATLDLISHGRAEIVAGRLGGSRELTGEEQGISDS